jgi:organic radical activating enzyme
MSKFHYTEKFYSIQGEGRFMGVPSVFLRMFGCNFRCKNFGRYEKDILGVEQTHNPEVIEIIKNLDQYSTFKDLPLVKTGCDSYSSVYPEFKKFDKLTDIVSMSEMQSKYRDGICEGIVLKISEGDKLSKSFKVVNKHFKRREDFNEELIKNKITKRWK